MNNMGNIEQEKRDDRDWEVEQNLIIYDPAVGKLFLSVVVRCDIGAIVDVTIHDWRPSDEARHRIISDYLAMRRKPRGGDDEP